MVVRAPRRASILALIALSLVSACAAPSAPPASQEGSEPRLAARQEVTFWISGEPRFLDPARASFANDISLVKQLFRGLLWFDQQLNVMPMAAREAPTLANGGISGDGTTYTFRLRDGLQWSDGQAVTAQQFESSVKRMLDPALAAQYASFYYDLRGAQEYNTFKEADPAAAARLREEVAVKAVDDKTITFTLKGPRPTFLQIMALWPVSPVRQDVIERHGESWTEAGNLVGNGPFILKEWVHQDHLSLTPNANWWGTDKPRLTGVVFRIITDRVQAFNAYLAGELDYVDVPPEQKDAVDGDPRLKAQNVLHTELATFAHQFNNLRPPFDNTKVRQAFSVAFDRETFLNAIFRGIGEVAYSWIPPGMPGYDRELGLQWKYEPNRARQLLAEAGYPEGRGLPRVTFTFSQTGTNPVVAQFTQEQFKRSLGVEIDLEAVESRAFQDRINRNDFQLALLGWGADYPDPDNWLPELWGCKAYQGNRCATYAGSNRAQYANPEFDRLMDQAAREADSARRLDLYGRAQKLLVDDTPVIFTRYRARNLLLNPRIRDLSRTAMDAGVVGDFFLERTYVGAS